MNKKYFLSGSLGFLFFTSIATAVDLIPFESNWDYMHPTDGINPNIADTDFDTTWYLDAAGFASSYNGPAFGASPTLAGPPNNSGTGPAPIGYGDITYIVANYPDNAANSGYGTVLTTPAATERGAAYFRHEFTVATAVANLALDIVADDGAAIYLDGVLLRRVNFNADDTWDARSAGSTIEGALQSSNINLGGLQSGTHVIAISLHQAGTSSTDLGFDLRLSDEGLAAIPFGMTDFDGTQTQFNLDGNINTWNRDITSGDFTLENADGGTITSDIVDLSTETDVLFSMQVRFVETSVASNFEPEDVFAARLEVLLPGNVFQTIQLAPFGLDSNQDGIVSGDEILPANPTDDQLNVGYVFAAELPNAAVGARVVIEAINNAGTEQFQLREVLFTDVRTSLVLGSVNVGVAGDIAMLVGPNAWVEDSPKQFSLNDADEDGGGKILTSELLTLSAAIPASASLELVTSETSSVSNFEASDTFAAWVEVIDAAGVGSVIQLVRGGADTNGDHAITGDEIAPGVDDAEDVTVTFNLAANLPAGTVQAQFFIAAENNSGSETFTISNVMIGEPVAEPISFQIVNISNGAGTSYDIEFESLAGTTYNLEFSPDLTAGSFSQVGAPIVGTAGTTVINHDPGVDAEGFYRVSTGQ